MNEWTINARDRFLAMIAEATRDAPQIRDAFRSVNRADFVPSYFLPDPSVGRAWPIRWKNFTEADGAAWAEHLYTAHGALVTKLGQDGFPLSSSTDPLLMVEMIKALRPDRGRRILEIGAGTGFNAAILSRVVGDRGRVVTVDLDDEVVNAARSRLRAYPNIRLEQADGLAGFVGEAPYQGIVVTANAARVEPAWICQLAPGGRLVVNLDGAIVSGLFAGQLTGVGSLTGRFLEHPQVGFTPLYGHPTDEELLPEDIGVDAVDETVSRQLPARIATALVSDEDALAFIQFAVNVRRSLHEIVGRDAHRPGVAFHRGGKSCWIFLAGAPVGTAAALEQTASTREGYADCGGDGELLDDLVGAHERWLSAGAPRKAELELTIEASGTRVSAGGRPICTTRLFSPAADLASL